MASQTTEFIDRFIEHFPSFSNYVKKVKRGVRITSENIQHAKQLPCILIHSPSMTGGDIEDEYSQLAEFFTEPTIVLRVYERDAHDHFGGNALKTIESITQELWKFFCTFNQDSEISLTKWVTSDGLTFRQQNTEADYAADVQFADNIKAVFLVESTYEITLKNLQIKSTDINTE